MQICILIGGTLVGNVLRAVLEAEFHCVCFAQRRVILQQFDEYLLLGVYLNQRYVVTHYICGNMTGR